MANESRKSTGVAGLDERLGGGLIPGTLTVVVGATGIGKTQLGLQFLSTSSTDERRGVIFDMTARGDSQGVGFGAHARSADISAGRASTHANLWRTIAASVALNE